MCRESEEREADMKKRTEKPHTHSLGGICTHILRESGEREAGMKKKTETPHTHTHS